MITKEPDRDSILVATGGAHLRAPRSLHWEIGNAFSAMLKQKWITQEQAVEAITLYQRIPLQLVDVSLAQAVTLAAQWNIYAYDAYILICAQQYDAPWLSLDAPLLQIARSLGLGVVEL